MRSPRIDWVDAARAFSVTAIILMHLNLWILPPVYEYGDVDIWKKISGAAGAFRLPVLFALSGFLVSERVRAGWSDRRNLLRAASSYYLYVVWLAIYAVVASVMPGRQPVEVTATGFWSQLALPQTPLWFVFFLAINIIVFTSLHRVHPAILLAGSAVVSYASIKLSLPSEFAMIERGLYYFFFFAIGIYGKQILIYLGSRRGLWWKVPLVIGIALVSRDIFWRVPGSATSYLGAIYLRDLSAIMCVAAVMSAVCMIRPISRFLGFIGSRTLPVYVMHVPLIWVLVWARDAYMPAMDLFGVRLLAPVLAILFILGASIGLHAVLKRFTVGRILFEVPAAVSDMILRRERRTSISQ